MYSGGARFLRTGDNRSISRTRSGEDEGAVSSGILRFLEAVVPPVSNHQALNSRCKHSVVEVYNSLFLSLPFLAVFQIFLFSPIRMIERQAHAVKAVPFTITPDAFTD